MNEILSVAKVLFYFRYLRPCLFSYSITALRTLYDTSSQFGLAVLYL